MLLFLTQETSICHYGHSLVPDPQHVFSTPSTCSEHGNGSTETQWQQVGMEPASPNPQCSQPKERKKKKEKELPPHPSAWLLPYMHTITAAELQPQKKERKRPKRQLGNPLSIGFPPHKASGLLLLQ